MQKNNYQKPISLWRRVSAAVFLSLLMLVSSDPAIATAVACSSTADCRNQINSLNNANAAAQSSLQSLINQAGSYQAAISDLQSQIDSLNQSINSNEAKQADIQNQITQKQADLDHQRQVLGEDIRSMYIDGQMTTIEELATSNNLSEYVDKEEYRTAVQNKIQQTMAEIAALQKQLQQEKSDVDSLLANQKTQEKTVADAKAQQDSLLAMNQSQQNTFNAQLANNKAQISKLQSAQAALNAQGSHAVKVAASGGSGGACDNGAGNGGYPMPWCDAAKDSVPTSYHPSASNLTNRECTSFAYWYFTSVENHTDFSPGYGDAKNWSYDTNYPLHDDPAVGSIGVKTAGEFGHVVIVKALPGQSFGGVSVPSGEVLVYEMNSDYTGHFRTSLRDIDTFAGFLYE